MGKRWNLNPIDRELQEALCKDLNILPVTARLLINRGLVERDKAFSFLRPSLKDLRSPVLMKGMEAAVERVLRAVERNELIGVYGDYDVDGTTASALLHLFFRECGVSTVSYIPDRVAEGYGLNKGAFDKLASQGVSLVITVDCGISDLDEVAYAKSIGLDVVVTDHHEPPSVLPDAAAIINPRQEGCEFPFKGLAGVGVAFYLAMALRTAMREQGRFKPGGAGEEPNLKDYLDLVCIGTVADMVPLLEENRVLVSHGLNVLSVTERPGLRALIDVARIKSAKIDTYNVMFQLAPRINAAGRMHSAQRALSLLVSTDPDEARTLALELDRENTARRTLERKILDEALELYDERDEEKAIVLFCEGWHPGVIGIVASRLSTRFTKPSVVIALDKEVGKGSARGGIKGFNVYEALKVCSRYLQGFGGHKAAAGLTVRRDMVEEFRSAFLEHAARTITQDDLIPQLDLDAEVSLDDIDHRMVAEIESLSPFGKANPEPLLCVRDALVVHSEVVGARHMKFKVKHNGAAQDAIAFGQADLHPMKGNGVDLAFYPYLDEWRGRKKLQLKVAEVVQKG